MANTARSKIADALIVELKKVDGTSPYVSDFHKNVEKGLKFWDEVDDFPYLCVQVGDETREYLPSGFKWGFLTLNIKVYVKDEDSEARLEEALEDIEYVIDQNCDLVYDSDNNYTTEDIRIFSITTDEGLLTPTGVGEVSLQVRYQVQ